MGDDAQMRKAAATRQGLVILGVLAGLTLIEYVIGLVIPWAWLLLLIALVKTVAVVQYFMHVSRVFSGEEGH